MKFLWILTLVSSLLCSCGTRSDKPTLYIFTWSNLFDPIIIKEFEEKFDCYVVTDIYDSNESMYAKLKLSSSRYDIIVPSQYYVSVLEKQKMIQQIDQESIENLIHLDQRYFKNKTPLYAVPLIVGFSGIAYRSDRVHDFDPSYGVFGTQNLRGRMTMLNDSREAIGAALKFLGYSINSVNQEEVEKAGELLIKWKMNLAKFESEQYKAGLASGEFLISQGFSIDTIQAQLENPNIIFVYPKEGAFLAIDCLSIPTAAQNVKLAYDFINFMISPEIAVKSTEYTGALIPVEPAYDKLSKEIRENPAFFPTDTEIQKMEMIEDLGENVRLYYRVWDKVKSG
jgi:spermidine/putrescine transport system substrate-binding protein